SLNGASRGCRRGRLPRPFPHQYAEGMSKQRLTVYLCQGKDCRKAWRRLTDSSPGKWLKRQLEQAGLPYKLTVVATESQAACDEAACLGLVCGPCAARETAVRRPDDADRVLAALRACAERAADQPAPG